LLGLHLTVHNLQGTMPTTLLAMTKTVVQGQTVIGLYFSADWCPPCRHFTPLLTNLYANK